MRMSGLFIFNPVLGRENIPVQLRAALGLICAVVVTPALGSINVQIGGIVQLIVMSLGELFIGLSLGVILSTVLYIVLLAGELIDMEMGITMAQMYDARTGVNMPIMGSLFNIIMVLSFFASNAHLTLISYLTDSFRLIAPGTVFPTQQSLHFIVSLGTDYFELGLRMAIPVVAVELIGQILLGFLMRAVPSINVFSIGMYITVIAGILILLVTVTVLVTMCGQLITFFLEKAAEQIRLMAGT